MGSRTIEMARREPGATMPGDVPLTVEIWERRLLTARGTRVVSSPGRKPANKEPPW